MPETRPPRPRSARARDSAVGQYRHKRSITDIGLAMLTPLVGQEFLDRYHLREPLNRGLKYGVKQVFSAAGASTRQFKKVQGVGKPPTRLTAGGAFTGLNGSPGPHGGTAVATNGLLHDKVLARLAV